VYLKGRISDTVGLNRALSFFYIAIPVGSALGYVAGGQIAAVYGWRTLFLFAAIPGALLAFGFLLLSGDGLVAPTSLGKEKASSASMRSGFARILASPLLVLLIIGYVFNTFALNGIAAFVVRHGTSVGLSESEASTYFGIILVVTGLVGTLGGGMLASRLAAKAENSHASLLRFVTYTTIAAVPFLAACFLAKTNSTFLAGCACAELLIFAGVAPLNSLIVEKAPHGYEAFTQGVTIFAIQLFGGFLGPVVIGGLADITGSLAMALQGTTLALLLSGLVWWLASRKGFLPHPTIPNIP